VSPKQPENASSLIPVRGPGMLTLVIFSQFLKAATSSVVIEGDSARVITFIFPSNATVPTVVISTPPSAVGIYNRFCIVPVYPVTVLFEVVNSYVRAIKLLVHPDPKRADSQAALDVLLGYNTVPFKLVVVNASTPMLGTFEPSKYTN
jgi:hypothetical protein